MTAQPSRTRSWLPGAGKTRPFRFGAAPRPDPDPPLEVGTMVGERYRVVGLLGEGGMGRVYRAEHVFLGRQVALKLLRREAADGETLARFEQEARAAGSIGHAAIVEVIDFARMGDGTVFLAMELLRGRTLEDWMAEPGTLAPALGWMAEVARGLAAAHEAGVVHRDIKPGNIFLAQQPGGASQPQIQPKILDFGIAKLLKSEAASVETEAGTVLGTPYYLAPERAMGHRLDPRADLYSFGVILYELLTGNVPFVDRSFMGILARHMHEPPLDPRQAAPDRAIPDGVAQLTMELLRKEPGERPGSAEEVATRLDHMLQEDAAPLAAVPTGPRGQHEAGDATVRLDEAADHPTAVPGAHGSAPRAAVSASQSRGTSPWSVGEVEAERSGPMTSFAGAPAESGAVTRARGAGERSGSLVLAEVSRGADEEDPEDGPWPARPRRWGLVVGLGAVALVAGALAWAVGGRVGSEESEAPALTAPGSAVPAAAAVGTPPVNDEAPSGESTAPNEGAPSPGEAPPAAGGEAAGPPEGEAAGSPGGAAAGEGEPAPASQDGQRRSSGPARKSGKPAGKRRKRRRTPKKAPAGAAPKPPPLPELKDDVYDD